MEKGEIESNINERHFIENMPFPFNRISDTACDKTEFSLSKIIYRLCNILSSTTSKHLTVSKKYPVLLISLKCQYSCYSFIANFLLEWLHRNSFSVIWCISMYSLPIVMGYNKRQQLPRRNSRSIKTMYQFFIGYKSCLWYSNSHRSLEIVK